MSQAFVKEGEGRWLHDISPTLNALINYLSNENNGIRIYEKETFINKANGKEVHLMSNGLSYSIGEDGRWFMLE
jgi:hypothetical protein